MSRSSREPESKERRSRTVRTSAGKLPKRTAEDMQRLRRAAKGPIDTSGIAEMDDPAAEAKRIRQRDSVKKVAVSIRLDEDLLAWFKSGGEGYQTRINDALRAHWARTATDADRPIDSVRRIEALLQQLKRRV